MAMWRQKSVAAVKIIGLHQRDYRQHFGKGRMEQQMHNRRGDDVDFCASDDHLSLMMRGVRPSPLLHGAGHAD